MNEQELARLEQLAKNCAYATEGYLADEVLSLVAEVRRLHKLATEVKDLTVPSPSAGGRYPPHEINDALRRIFSAIEESAECTRCESPWANVSSAHFGALQRLIVRAMDLARTGR